MNATVTVMRFWDRHPREIPKVRAMSAEKWKQHVDAGHINYYKDCLTCVMARVTGRRHARVRHPEMFNLTVDVAGPVKPGLDVSSKGTMGRGLRYLVVARYTMPSEFVKAYSGREPPEDHGLDVAPSRLPLLQPQDNIQGVDELPEGQLVDPLEGEDHEAEGEGVVEDPDEQGDHLNPLLPHGVPGHQGPSFIGATHVQQEEYKDHEDSLYEPSNVDPEDDEPQEEFEGNEGAPVIADCVAPQSTYLTFARGLNDNKAAAVKAVIQDIILYLEAHGLPCISATF